MGKQVEQIGNVWNQRSIEFAKERNALEVTRRIAEVQQETDERVSPLLQLEGNSALEREGHERGIVDEADVVYDEAYDKVREKLTNTDQLQLFEKRFQSMRLEGMGRVVDHYSKQHQVVKKAAFEAGYSRAVTSVRTNVGDTAFFEDKLSQVKEDYNLLHPGTDNGAILDKIDQDMRVEYLQELMVVAPKLVDRQLEKWRDKIPASVAKTIKDSARTEDEKQEANKLAAGALQIETMQGPQEAAAWIRKNASTPEIAGKANTMFSAQISLQRRLRDEAEKDALDRTNESLMEMWVKEPAKLTPDFILQNVPDANAQNWWLEKLTKGDSPTSQAMKGNLLARAYGEPGKKPLTWDELLGYTNPDPSRPGQTLSMNDALEIWKKQLYFDRMERVGFERDAEQAFDYERNKAMGEVVRMVRGFADMSEGGITRENENEIISNMHSWMARNPKATGPEIVDRAKKLGEDALVDYMFDGWVGRPSDIYEKDVLAAEVAGGELDYKAIVEAQIQPETRERLRRIIEEKIATEEGGAAYRPTPRLLWEAYSQWGQEYIDSYEFTGE